MLVILSTQEAEIRRIAVQNQPGQIVPETLFQKNPSQKRASGVAQGVSPEFKPQYGKKKKKSINKSCMVPHSCNTSYLGDSRDRKLTSMRTTQAKR
jgi:hypothetical protein